MPSGSLFPVLNGTFEVFLGTSESFECVISPKDIVELIYELACYCYWEEVVHANANDYSALFAVFSERVFVS